MRENGTLSYLLADHLGSTSITANSSGAKVAELRYNAWGDTRYSWGTTPTTYRYTGQRRDSYINMYYMGARWYDQQLGRWISPDTIIPQLGNPQSLSRYSYALNDPVRYNDPTGHAAEGGATGDPYEGKWKPAWIVDLPSGNYDKGRHSKTGAEAEVEGIVMHKTAGIFEDSLDWLLHSSGKDAVSANYLVDTEGTIYQLVAPDDTAWHAGGRVRDSVWTPTSGDTHIGADVNAYSIGIEVVGATGKPYSPQQKAATEKLVAWLVCRYDIDPRDIVGHSDVSRDGKEDGREYITDLQVRAYWTRGQYPPVRGGATPY